MICLPSILALLIMIPTSSPTIAGLYLIGRDALNNTLNTALDAPKQFLEGYNAGRDQPFLNSVIQGLSAGQTLVNFTVALVSAVLNLVIFPVDFVVEGIRESSSHLCDEPH